MLAKKSQVIVRAVHDEFVLGQSLQKRFNVQAGERVDQFIAGGSSDLEQADFFGISMKAVGFRVQSHPRACAQTPQQAFQFRIAIYHCFKCKFKAKSSKLKIPDEPKSALQR